MTRDNLPARSGIGMGLAMACAKHRIRIRAGVGASRDSSPGTSIRRHGLDWRSAIFLGLVCLLLPALPVTALASDWYTRLALGYEWSRSADFRDVDCLATQPPALFGCSRGDDGRRIGAYGDFGDFPVFEVALGRNVLEWMRMDVSLAYRSSMDYQGNANFLSVGANQPVDGSADTLTAMINLFVELDGLITRDITPFKPYVGLGAGLSHNRLDAMRFQFPENPGRHRLSITPSGSSSDFAFMLAVGTDIALSPSLVLDLAWRYVDLGQIETDEGVMIMDTIPAGIRIDRIKAPLRSHGPTLGLRYHF